MLGSSDQNNYEFVQVDKTIEEYTCLGNILPQLLQCEVALGWLRLDHVIHLAEYVDKKNRLMV